MPLGQRQATSASNKQQPEATTSATKIDPIRSIANVLNYHKQDKKLGNSGLGVGSGGGNGDKENSSTEQQQVARPEELRRQTRKESRGSGGKEANISAKEQLKKTVTSGHSEPNLSSKLSPPKPNPKGAGQSNRSRSEKDRHTGENSQAELSSQVDQGNSYLYAYNDFIASNRSSSQQKQQQQQPQSQVTLNNHNIGDKLKVARQKQQPQSLKNLGAKSKSQICLVCGKQVHLEAEQEGEEETTTTTANKKIPTTNKQQVNSALASSSSHQTKLHNLNPNKSTNQREFVLLRESGNICISGSGHLFSLPANDLKQENFQVDYDEDNEDDDEEDEYQDEEQQQEVVDVLLDSHQLEDEEDYLQDDTLNYILNQQQQQQQQRQAHEHLTRQLRVNQQPLTDLALPPGSYREENPNHLRQYLQIEESFNSFKARKRGLVSSSPAAGGQSNITLARPPGNIINTSGQIIEHYGHELLPAAPRFTQQQFLEQQQRHKSSSHLNLISNLTQNLKQQLNLNTRRHKLAKRFSFGAAHSDHLTQLGNNSSASSNNTTNMYAQQLAGLVGDDRRGANPLAHGDQLTGQPGAYYMTDTNPSDHHHHHNQHHLAHQPQHHLHHLHYPGQHSAGGATAPSAASYPMVSSDSSLGSSGQAFAGNGGQSALRRMTSAWFGGGGAGAGSNSSSGIITNTSVVGHKASRLCCLCSKKCLFISCLMIILFIFILVISLSAYLNFLINSSRTNLLPLSGRFRYVRDDSAGASTAQNQQLQLFNNRTSSEFLTKQTQFETILRGAFDRTQSMLKSFPNHLVKLEVYSFKPVVPQTPNVANLLASPVVWVYFRLFVNKKSLAQDPQLMKRKSPDESFDKLFLPRLTQQTLHSGFESLMATFGAGSSASPDQLVAGETLSNKRFGGSGGSGGGGASGASTGSKPARSSRAAGQSSTDGHLANNANNKLQQPVTGMQSQQQVANAKSFDDQISRLMPLIESIDLQSIQVSQEFDMQQTGASFMPNNNGNNNLPLQSTIMSDNLRASQPINRPASSLDSSASTEVNSNINEPTTTQVPTNNGGRQKSQRVQQQQQQQETTTIGNVDKSLSSESPTRKFTLSGYRDNSTRPTTSSTTTTTTTTSTVKPASTFLVNQQQRKPTGATVQQTQQVKPSTQSRSSGNNSSSSNTLKEIAQATSRFPPVPTTDPKVVRLVSGQPVVSQSGQQLMLTSTSRPPAAPPTSGSSNGAGQSTRVFGPLLKLDQDGNSNNNNQKVSSDTTTLVVSGNNNNNNPTGKSIEELWQDALNAGANQRLRVANSTASVMQQSQVSRANNERSSKPITVATITNNQVGQQASTSQAASTAAPSEWQKVSLLSADVSNTIRAQLNASLNNNTSSPGQVTMSTPATTTTTTTTTTSTPATTSTQKSPKVSPHLRTAGSIISTSTGANQRQASPGSLNEQPSAVILSRDTPSLSSSSSSQQQAKPANSRGQAEPKKLKNSSSSQRSNSTSGADSTTSVRQPSKPKQQKLKKANNNNNSRQSNSNSQNIRLVDEFLANSNNATTAATLPTATIELTRSTTALPPRSTTPILVLSLPVIDTSEPEQPVRLSSGEQTSNRVTASDFVPANQLARPGTTSFSGQWRPLSNNSASSNNDQDFWVVTTNNQSNRTSQQQPAKPNKSSLALIIGTERLPANLNHVPSASTAGSQSPFAMSPSLLEQPARNPQQQRQRFTNSFRSPTGNARQPSLGGNNDFESHRVSRMRSSVRESARHHEDSSPMVTFSDIERGSSSSTSSSSFASSASTSTSTTTTTSSSLINSDARIVDDFMITPADRLNEPRGSTLLPPLVLSGFQQDDQGGRVRSAPVADQLQLIEAPIHRQVDVQPPKKTRGPFAFETLRSVPSPLSDPFAPATGLDSGDPNGPAHSGRAERSPSGPQNSLIRKRLYVGNDDLSVSSTSSSRSGENGDAEESADGSTGHSGDSDNDIVGLRGQQGESRLFGNRRVVVSGDAGGHQLASKCQYFGCRAATTGEFTCLNNTQICDDFIDCRDESDELDCVSLLKHDQVSGSTGNSSKLSFSNGAGIVYLNRRGSLAPMCIDYFGPLDGVRSSSSSSGLQEQSADLIKRQHELIRQINTIGQYACSLQSFSRLVSVKINHHDLVDGLNLIRSSKLFHRLSIQGGNSSSGDNANSESSFRSGHSSDYEVDLSTSSECPSQRTVFVKCGHFECGQDSFSVGSATSSAGGQVDSITTAAAAAPKHLKNGLIINDFPWLVKLYWFDELACHGYLIDESWLITSSECFVNKTNLPLINNDGQSGWTAEISYEHYGNDDYQSIESNRRNVKQILIQQQQQQQRTSDEGIESVGETIKSSIVLAKLEKPVRFSPLNRPICLPTTTRTTTTTVTANNPNKSLGNTDLEFDKTFKDCVSVSLPTGNTNDGNSSVWSSSSASASAPSPTQQQQDLILNKVKLLKAQDCLATTTTTTTTQSSQNLPPSFNKNFICVDEEDGQDNDDDDDERQHNPNESIKDGLVLTSSQGNNINNNNNGYNLAKVEDQDEYQRESRRVHSGISKKPNNRIVAGAANDEIDGVGGQGGEAQEGAEPQRDHRRSDSRANQQATGVLICSINQASRSRSRWTVVGVQVKTPIGFKGANLGKRDTHRRLFSTVSSQIDWIVDTMNPKTGLVDSTNPSAQPPESYMSQGGNELNPMLAAGETKQQLQTCNKFKCSSGECLSWSRICDGLYDCSSHDDEKDCHK